GLGIRKRGLGIRDWRIGDWLYFIIQHSSLDILNWKIGRLFKKGYFLKQCVEFPETT
ncbi:MAG: hypothetical protein ACI8SN_002318, partial [Algoriphagus sp.]